MDYSCINFEVCIDDRTIKESQMPKLFCILMGKNIKYPYNKVIGINTL